MQDPHHVNLHPAVRYGAIPSPLAQEHLDVKLYTRRNFHIIAACIGLSDSSRGLFFPTLWLLIETNGGNHADLGTAVALFSAGRILSAPLQGWACERYGYSKILILSNLFTIFGAMVYASSATLSAVYWGQFLVGIGAGDLGVCRAYVAEHAALKERTVQLSYLTIIQFGAFTVLPFIGALLASLGKHLEWTLAVPVLGTIRVDEFSTPALSLGLSAALMSLLLFFAFREDEDLGFNIDECRSSATSPMSIEAVGELYEHVFTTSQPNEEIELMQETESESLRILPGTRSGRSDVQADIDTMPVSPTPATRASAVALACTAGGCVLNMSVKGTLGVYETLSSSVAMDTLHWSVSSVGWVFAAFGLLGILSLVALPYLTRCFTDMDLLLGGLSFMIASTVLMSSTQDLKDYHFMLALWLLYSTGFPIAHTALLGAFSKVTKQGKQGIMMGVFAAAGSAARIGFPLIAGYLTEKRQNDVDIFIIMTAQLVACASVCAYFRSEILQVTGQNDSERAESE